MVMDEEKQQTKMETDEQLSSESDGKDKSSVEEKEKEENQSEEEEVKSAPAVKHLEENELFSEYYLGQGILTTDEVEQFCEFVKKPMPWTFRISNLGSNVSEVQSVLKLDFLTANSEALSSLPWYPDEMAWQVKMKLVTEMSMKPLSQFIMQQSACGNVEQHDAVGMLPALLLNVEPRCKVLDMRAMNSVQLVDLVHSGCTVLDKNTDGVIIAGDPLFRRCCDLAEFIPNLFSPHFAIANFEPSELHGLYIENKDKEREPIRYDRILCDMHSSNDGMFRSNPEGIRNWSPAMSHDHHSRMCRILHSGTCQLAVGGRLVFCTHSMNPIENEAVIASLLMQQKGSVELVDVSAELPNLQYKSGLTKWKMMTRAARWFEDYSDLRETLRYRVNESVFPPSEEKVAKFHLERCIRILPHQQDTSGLFIAVVQRTRALEDILKEEREAWMKAQREKAEAVRKRVEEARLAAEKAAAEKKAEAEKEAAEKAAAEKEAAEKEAAEKSKDEKDEKSDDKSLSADDKTAEEKETVTDTSSVTEKAAVESKDDNSGEAKEETTKVSSESKEEKEDKEQMETSVMETSMTEDDSKTESSHEKDEIMSDRKRSEDWTHERRRDHDADDFRHGHDDELPAKRPRRDVPITAVFTSITEDDPVWISVRDFFGITSDFAVNQLICRGEGKMSLFYVSPTLKQLIDCNQATVNFVHAGVRVFCRESDADSTCKYRLTQEGLPAMFPFVSRQVVQLTKDEFIAVLSSQRLPISSLGTKTKQAMSKIEKGSLVFICRLNPRKADGGQLMVASWSDGQHCRTFLAHYKRLHYLRACGATVEDADKKPLDVTATEALTAFSQAAAAMERY